MFDDRTGTKVIHKTGTAKRSCNYDASQVDYKSTRVNFNLLL